MAKSAPITGRERLLRDKARAVADKYLPDPKAPEGTGPWAAWALERIAELEAELDLARRTLEEAVKSPPKPPPEKLTAKEFAFAQEYLVDMNATQAAIRAGYSAKTAGVIGYENLRKPHVAACVSELMKERNQRAKWDAQKMFDRLSEDADADIADLYDENNAFLPPRMWPLVWRMGLITGVETNELWEGSGKDRVLVGQVVKVKFTERVKIKELLGKHADVQAFKERVAVIDETPIQRLYNQIAGTGIRPMTPEQAPGIAKPPIPVMRPGLPTIRPSAQPVQQET